MEEYDFQLTAKGVALIVLGILLLAGTGYVIGSIFFGFGTADEDEYRVETEWGATTGEVYEEGLYFVGTDSGMLPLPQGWSHGTDGIPASIETTTIEVSGDSADGQRISAPISVSYEIVDADAAVSFRSDSDTSAPFKSFEQWEEDVGEPAIRGAVTDAVAQTSALELLEEADIDANESEVDVSVETIRNDIAEEAEQQIEQENSELSPEVSIQAVRVLEVSLSDELDEGLEQIAVAAAKAQQEIEQAEGEAETIRIEADARQSAAQKMIDVWGDEDKALQADWIEAIEEDDGTIVIDVEAAPMLDV